MMRAFLPLALLAACSSSSPPPSPTSPDAGEVTPDGAPPEVAPDEVTTLAANAICSALFRCCDDDLVTYFAPYAGNELLAAYKDRLPPIATLDEQGCRDVLKPMLDIVPFGDWVRQASEGKVALDATAVKACVKALDDATCGDSARQALWDSTCFGFGAPSGGEVQRKMFRRTRTAGEACSPVRDGIGAAFYGSCDPTKAFCCYEVAGREGCQYPYDADSNARTGTCQPTAAVDATCSPSAPVKLCSTGTDCDSDSLTCVAPIDAVLAPGAACIDDSFRTLGTCMNSYCDLFGTKKCETPKPNGDACQGGEECQSGLCRTTCVAMDLCTGEPTVDPEPEPTATGEACTSALDFVAASTPATTAGFTHRLAGTFGTSNDYNPYDKGGLPPSCSVVYDAKGKERVYAITLQPGDKLTMQLELADGKQAGMYLLDTCPEASWTDFDNTMFCGSNEYNAGFCGAIGCQPAKLAITYPAKTGQQDNPPATFWVVIDQVNGDDATSFTLDWKID